MSFQKVDFSDIRIVLSVQGYSLDYQYIVREIGFWFNGHSGSIPFNCKINRNQLDIANQTIITKSEEQMNGIRLKKSITAGLALSETRAVLRALYHLNSSSKGKFIGISSDDNITGLLFKSGLGPFVKNLKHLSIFENNQKLPTNEEIISALNQYPNKFKICNLHDNFTIIPMCAKVKAEFLAMYCMNYSPSVSNTPIIPLDAIRDKKAEGQFEN